MLDGKPASVSATSSTALAQRLAGLIGRHGGWLPFDQWMAAALYTPGLGYYVRDSRQFGALPTSGSDFVTAPELSPLFGQALAAQVRQALQATGTAEVWEFGAGSGALAAQLLAALGPGVQYRIVDLSAALRQRQAERLAPFAAQVQWCDELPAQLHGVVVGNEVLDAMPVQLLHFDGGTWFERGVVVGDDGGFNWQDRPTDLRPPLERGRFLPGAVVEIHPQAEAFIRTLAERLQRGAAFFIDYGFPEHEYYHPQRHGGTLMAHRAHVASTEVLAHPGEQDITAHVNFSSVALTAQDAGLQVLGYTSQARFLLNCGLPALMAAADARTQTAAQPLILEHEMGELFKVIGLVAGDGFDALGFAAGDRSHTL